MKNLTIIVLLVLLCLSVSYSVIRQMATNGENKLRNEIEMMHVEARTLAEQTVQQLTKEAESLRDSLKACRASR